MESMQKAAYKWLDSVRGLGHEGPADDLQEVIDIMFKALKEMPDHHRTATGAELVRHLKMVMVGGIILSLTNPFKLEEWVSQLNGMFLTLLEVEKDPPINGKGEQLVAELGG